MKKDTNQQLMTNWRWWMVVLLFVATTVNYMDRQVLSLTWKEFIAPEFHWTDSDYGTITAVFSLFYAFAMLFAGKFVDWMGTKKGYLWAIGVWSFGACVHALCGWATMHIEGYESIEAMKAVEAGTGAALAIASVSVWLFLAARSILALGEAGNFPAAIKTTAEYFPKKDRAFATSIFNAGASVGALVAPATIPPLAAAFGWEMAFIIIGALGFIWMGFWVFMYDKPQKSKYVNEAELAYQVIGFAIEQYRVFVERCHSTHINMLGRMCHICRYTQIMESIYSTYNHASGLRKTHIRESTNQKRRRIHYHLFVLIRLSRSIILSHRDAIVMYEP